jgi:hypothetical protein
VCGDLLVPAAELADVVQDTRFSLYAAMSPPAASSRSAANFAALQAR